MPPAVLIELMRLASPALPVGGFSYSEALEDWERVGSADPDGPLGAMSRRHAQGARQLASLFAGR